MSSWGHGLVFFGSGLVSDEASRARTSEIGVLGRPTERTLGFLGTYRNRVGAEGTYHRRALPKLGWGCRDLNKTGSLGWVAFCNNRAFFWPCSRNI